MADSDALKHSEIQVQYGLFLAQDIIIVYKSEAVNSRLQINDQRTKGKQAQNLKVPCAFHITHLVTCSCKRGSEMW